MIYAEDVRVRFHNPSNNVTYGKDAKGNLVYLSTTGNWEEFPFSADQLRQFAKEDLGIWLDEEFPQ